MNPLLHDLPYDATGHNRDNRTKREAHDLSAQEGLPFRTFPMDKGYFYTDNMVLEDNKGYTLIEGVDYQCTCINPEIIEDTGLNACALIVVKNPRVGNEIFADVQMVGGKYKSVGYSIVELARNLLNNTRKVKWQNIERKPDAYNPNGHLHALWDLYHFTPRTAQLKRMTAAIQKKGGKILDGVYSDWQRQLNNLGGDLATLDDLLTQHIANTEDPHDITKTQVGLSVLANYGLATQVAAQQANASIRTMYATPWSAKLSIDANYTPVLVNHVNNRNNPHRTTAAQLSAYTVGESNDLLALYATRGATMNTSTLWGGLTGISHWNTMRQGNITANITSGLLDQMRYSVGPADANWVMSAAGTWLNIAALFAAPDAPKPVSVQYAQSATNTSVDGARAIIATLYANAAVYPVGTLVIFNTNHSYGIGTGNGSITTYLKGQFMVRRFYANGNINDWQFAQEPPR